MVLIFVGSRARKLSSAGARCDRGPQRTGPPHVVFTHTEGLGPCKAIAGRCHCLDAGRPCLQCHSTGAPRDALDQQQQQQPDTSYALTQHTLTEASLRLSPAVATGSTHSGHASIAVGRLEMDLISSSSNSPHVPDSLTQRNLIDARQWLLPAVATAWTHGGHASSAVGPGRNEVHLISSSSNIGCSYYPDKSIASSPAAATASTQGGHASCTSIVPVPRGIPSGAPYPPMMCYAPHVADYGDRYNMLDMGVVLDYDWLRLPCGARVTAWVLLPGMSGSFIRLREARVHEGEHGLAMFPWGNYKGISRPGMPEYTMDFHNTTAPGHPYYFCLYPEDCLLWCPMKYVWPACGCCAKFLFPPGTTGEQISIRRR